MESLELDRLMKYRALFEWHCVVFENVEQERDPTKDNKGLAMKLLSAGVLSPA